MIETQLHIFNLRNYTQWLATFTAHKWGDLDESPVNSYVQGSPLCINLSARVFVGDESGREELHLRPQSPVTLHPWKFSER